MLLAIVANHKKDWQLLDIAKQIQNHTNVIWHVLYITPKIPDCYLAVPSVSEIHAATFEQANAILKQLGNLFNITTERLHLKSGPVKRNIDDVIKKHNIDIIVCSS